MYFIKSHNLININLFIVLYRYIPTFKNMHIILKEKIKSIRIE